MGYALSRDDLLEHLRDQVRFMESSTKAFDGGFAGEAARLTVSLRLLLHESRHATPLLGQLGVLDSLEFVHTANVVDPRALNQMPGLVRTRHETGPGGSSARYVAPLDNLPPPRLGRTLPFREWWEVAVTKDGDGRIYARKDFVLSVANQDGGAHVDPTLDEEWARLTRENSMGTKVHIDENPLIDMESPAPASIRQIAHEVLRTIEANEALIGLK